MRIGMTFLAAALVVATGCGKKADSTGAGSGTASGSDTGSAMAGTASGSAMAGGSGSDAPVVMPTTPVPDKVTVDLANAKGESVGTATLSADPKGVSIALDLKNLPAGDHAIHVHETAKCVAPDFKSAGGHWNPAHKHHGMENPEGPHAGDMSNITVGADGTLKVTIVAPGVTWDRAQTSVFGPAGTAIVIHASADDMKSDPAGNAGERIACGVLNG